MSFSKKRHIQESNLILEQRYLNEAKIDPTVIDFIKQKISSSGSTEIQTLFNKNQNQLSKDEIMKILNVGDTWCTNEVKVKGSRTPEDDRYCKKIIETISGEQDSRLSGLFGSRLS